MSEYYFFIMTVEQIRQSGVLELYVLGDLDMHDNSMIRAYLNLFPELKADLYDIENTFYRYAKAHAIIAPSDLIQQIFKNVTKAPSDSKSIRPPALILGISALLLLLGLVIFLVISNQKRKNLNQSALITLGEKCDENKQDLQERITLYRALNDKSNQVIQVQATEKYQGTKMIFNTNQETKRNFIQFQFLPRINNNQSYQLWSLKDGADPIPLDVFEDTADLLEVIYAAGTNAYAITIEPRGGQKSPTLENLVGVFPMS